MHCVDALIIVCVPFNFRFGKIEGVKILPQRYPNIGVAAFIDFYDIKSATEAKEAKHKLHGHELRTNFKVCPGERHDMGGSKSHDRHEERHDRDDRERYWDCAFTLVAVPCVRIW